ncbi:MAG: FHA domain-containing protein, partial [Phycisphaeraceae bacterium]
MVRFEVTVAGDSLTHDWSPSDGPLVVGRGASAGLRIQNDVLSREHARVQLSTDQIVLIDLESRNGITINGTRVWQPTPLKDGDSVGVGDVAIRVDLSAWLAEQKQADDPDPQDATTVTGQNIDVTRPVSYADGGGDLTAEVTIAPGDDSFDGFDDPVLTKRQEFPLPQGRTLIGRDSNCQIALESLMISRLHAEVIRENDRVLVRDLNSSNGTAVNGKNITRRTDLKPGDRLTIGPYQIDYDGKALVIEPPSLGLEVRVRGLSRVVKNMQTG